MEYNIVPRQTLLEMDIPKLIAEVKKRPLLWDVRCSEYLDRINTPLAWQEIAKILNVEVEACKKKWKNLRDAYRAEVRRAERRSAGTDSSEDKAQAKSSHSKWGYFDSMSFVAGSKRVRGRKPQPVPSKERKQSTHTDDSDGHSFDYSIKLEPYNFPSDDESEKTERLLKTFNEIATSQAVRRLSENLAQLSNDENTNEGETPEAIREKRRKVSTEQVHFLEDLEKEEQKLIQATRQDISRSHPEKHIGDSDYNFLISFWPHMKKMNHMQNVEFRAKMSELLYTTLAENKMGMSCSSTPPLEHQFTEEDLLSDYVDNALNEAVLDSVEDL